MPTVKDKIDEEKRKSGKLWQQTRHADDKGILSSANFLNLKKNKKFQQFITKLDNTSSTDYSLWKATKLLKKATTARTPILKSDQKWAKSNLDKANVFANHLREIFMPNPNSGRNYSFK